MTAHRVVVVALIVLAAAVVVVSWWPWNDISDVTLPSGETTVILAAGDIGKCDIGDPEATARLIEARDGVVAALGDLAYPDGSRAAFGDCYDPAWGRFRERTRPTPGNHDAETEGARPYFEYFGELAGDAPGGWYSYDLGAWHVVVLNSVCELAGGCGPDSPQVEWLRGDLEATGTANILAYYHHPRISTGEKEIDGATVQTFWEVLAEAGADVVLNGDDHTYQRFTPLDGAGDPDRDGIRQFIVGTGGADLYAFGPETPELEFRQNEHLGVLRLDLETCGYRWSFLPVGGGEPLDGGRQTGTC